MSVPRKPRHIFDRDREWEGLVRFATSKSSDVRLGVVSGRRRQGKTFLLDALVDKLGGFFYSAVESTTADSLDRFGTALADYTGGGRYAFDDWEDALRRLFTVVREGVIVIDELPYLVKASPSLPSVLQAALDPRGAARQGRAKLLLCGSAMSVMGGLLAARAPLRGRASLELVVQPLHYRDASTFWGIDDPRLAVLVHAIVGGTPAYRREFVASDAPTSLADFDDWVLRTVLNPQVPLFREARYLLAEETNLRDTALYHTVLTAIARGNTSRGAIAGFVGRQSADIGHPLSVLEDTQLVTRESDPFNRGRSYYRICEPLITFYEAIMRREWTRLERDDAEGAWRNSQATFLAQVVGPHFEALCREWAIGAGEDVFGAFPGQVAAGTVNDSANKAQIQVDVVALTPEDPSEPRRILSLGEAKWDQVMGRRHLSRLRRARDLLAAKGYVTDDTTLACYSGAGFDDQLRAAAAKDSHILLVGLDRLYA